MRNDLLVGVLILMFVIELYRLCRHSNLQKRLFNKPQTSPARPPRQLKPKSEKDCPHCQAQKSWNAPATELHSATPKPWTTIKSKGGRKKRIATQGYGCPNPACDYYTITDANIHALVGYTCTALRAAQCRCGTHGAQETIQEFRCQACQQKFTVRRHTPATCTQVQAVLYRLKTHSHKVQLVLWLLALGVDISALEEALQIRESTLRTPAPPKVWVADPQRRPQPQTPRSLYGRTGLGSPAPGGGAGAAS